MSDEQLAKEFSNVYDEIYTYAMKAKKKIYNKNHTIEIEIVLSECYLHISKCKDEISDVNKLKSYCKQWLRENLKWENNSLYKEKRIAQGKYFEPIKDYKLSRYENFHTICDYDFIEQMSKDFYDTLPTVEKRLFDIYFTFNKTTHADIAEHLSVSLSSGYETLKDCRLVIGKYKAFIKQYI